MNYTLLTGGSGFIGHYLVARFIHAGLNVIVPVRRKSNLPLMYKPTQPEVVKGNFYNDNLLQRCSTFPIKTIIHLAALRGVGHGNWLDYQQVNVKGTRRLVDFALSQNVKLFVFCSTVGVYGTIPPKLPANIKSRLSPDNFYHKSKFDAEQLVIQKLKGKIPFVILRPTIVYGPDDNGFLTRLINLVRSKQFPLIYRDIRVHLLHVRTLSEFILHLVKKEYSGEMVVNLADRNPVSFHELVHVIYYYFHGNNYPSYLKMPGWCFSVGKYVCDVLNFRKMKTSMQLVSESWYYDVTPMWKQFPLTEINTLEAIRDLLEKNYPGKRDSKNVT